MDLYLITDSQEGHAPLIDAASTAGWTVSRHSGPIDQASLHIQQLQPDAAVFVTDAVDDLVLQEMRNIRDSAPLPIVVMTRDKSEEAIDAAVKAGTTAYVVDCSDPGRIGSLLKVARSRFAEIQRLNRELDKTRSELADRKVIDRAKGIIMQARGLSEDEAFKAMRKLAMDRNKRISEVAEQIIAAAEVLV